MKKGNHCNRIATETQRSQPGCNQLATAIREECEFQYTGMGDALEALMTKMMNEMRDERGVEVQSSTNMKKGNHRNR